MKRTIITFVTCLLLSATSYSQRNYNESCLLELINTNFRSNKPELVFFDSLYQVTKNHNNSIIVFPEKVISYRGFKISDVSSSEYGFNDTIKQTTLQERYDGFCPGLEFKVGIRVYDTSMVCVLLFDVLYNNDDYMSILSDENFRNIIFTITKHTFTRKHYFFRRGDDESEYFYLTMFVF